MRILVCRESER